MSVTNNDSNKKRITSCVSATNAAAAAAAAAAVATLSLMPIPTAHASLDRHPNTRPSSVPIVNGPPNSNSNNLHETLWWGRRGNTMNDDDDDHDDYLLLDTGTTSTTTLNIPRGGTDEPQMDSSSSSSKKDKNKKKKKRDKDKKEEKKSPTPDSSKKKRTNNKNNKKDDNTKGSSSSKGGGKKGSASSTAEKENKSSKRTSTTTTNNPMMEEILKQEDYYDILGLSRSDAQDQSKIKKAYRRRAVLTHPDKTGGDRRAFDKLAEAYEVLLDDEKRDLYDRYGKDGLDPTKMMAGGGRRNAAEEMFRSFFGGQPSSSYQQQQSPINRTVRYQLQVTLEELYQGRTKKVTVEAPRGNSFYAQFEPPSRKKQVDVTIPRGAFGGTNIVLSGEMDFDSYDSPPGDLIFQIHPRPHRIFTRKGYDLAMEITISLQEAIIGFSRRFQYLNGKYITIESAKQPITLNDLHLDDDDNLGDHDHDHDHDHDSSIPLPTASSPPRQQQQQQQHEGEKEDNNDDDQVEGRSEEEQEQQQEGGGGGGGRGTADIPPVNIYIRTGDVQVLKGKGMPKNPQGTEFGDLYVQYTVELPKGAATGATTDTAANNNNNNNLTPSERMELARLLEKLEGGGGGKGKQKHASKGSSGGSGTYRKKEVYQLEPARASDFGRSSGPIPTMEEEEEGHHHHHPYDDYQQQQQQQQQQQFPFAGMGHRQFFFSSSGQSPFFGQQQNFEDDENVQCRQM